MYAMNLNRSAVESHDLQLYNTLRIREKSRTVVYISWIEVALF